MQETCCFGDVTIDRQVVEVLSRVAGAAEADQQLSWRRPTFSCFPMLQRPQNVLSVIFARSLPFHAASKDFEFKIFCIA